MSASDSTETVKVFVGNLSFKITHEQLKAAFETHGHVVSANIITRGPRSLGYGFVEFANQSDAEKAVAALNQTELDSRPINVEIAKPRAALDEQAAASSSGEAGKARARRPNNRRVPRARRAGAAPAAGTSAPRAPREPRSTEPKESSKNTLFVANLPFSVDDAGLAQLFIDQGFTPKIARVVLRRDRSKGFGFVEFNDEAQQIGALNALDKFEVEGRPLTVKIAFATPDAAPAAN